MSKQWAEVSLRHEYFSSLLRRAYTGLAFRIPVCHTAIYRKAVFTVRGQCGRYRITPFMGPAHTREIWQKAFFVSFSSKNVKKIACSNLAQVLRSL